MGELNIETASLRLEPTSLTALAEMREDLAALAADAGDPRAEAAIAALALGVVKAAAEVAAADPAELAQKLGEQNAAALLDMAAGALGDVTQIVERTPDILGGVGGGELSEMREMLGALAGSDAMLGAREIAPDGANGGGGKAGANAATDAVGDAISTATGAADEAAHRRDDAPTGSDRSGEMQTPVFWDVDHENDPESNIRYNIETDPFADSDNVTDPESGRDYDVVKEDEADHSSDYALVEETVVDEFGDEVTTLVIAKTSDLAGGDDDGDGGDDEGGADAPDGGADDGSDESGGDDGGAGEGGSDADDQETPRQGDDNGPPPENVGEGGPTYGLTQPELTGNEGAPLTVKDEGPAPWILTDPDQDRLDFTPPPGGATYGLTQPPLVDDASGGAPLAPDGPTGGEIMVMEDTTFSPGYSDDLF